MHAESPKKAASTMADQYQGYWGYESSGARDGLARLIFWRAASGPSNPWPIRARFAVYETSGRQLLSAARFASSSYSVCTFCRSRCRVAISSGVILPPGGDVMATFL